MITRFLSLPARMARCFSQIEGERAQNWFVGSDPSSGPLGSGAGSIHLLRQAWEALGGGATFQEWISNGSPKLVVHAGGHSRRLPAYAPIGKSMIPMPALKWAHGQRIDQTLLDFQRTSYERLLGHAPATTRVMIASGDVLVTHAPSLPRFPSVDVLGFGLWVKPELASNHGVFFCPRQDPRELTFFLQKPTAQQIEHLSIDHLFLIDVGIWMLSERALAVLEKKSGDPIRSYELYGEFGLGLGTRPTQKDAEINALSCAVLPLPGGQFFHFGTNRSLIESVAALQNLVLDQTQWGQNNVAVHPDIHLQNCRFDGARSSTHASIWIENAVVPASWNLTRDHVITGVPENDWDLFLPPGTCLDFVPVGDDRLCLRVYSIDDPFRGDIWMGSSAGRWFIQRGIAPYEGDMHDAAVFPVLQRSEWTADFIQWLISGQDGRFASEWKLAEKISARSLIERADIIGINEQRRKNRQRSVMTLARNGRQNNFYHLDLESTAQVYAANGNSLPPELPDDQLVELTKRLKDSIFRAAVLRYQSLPGSQAYELNAFGLLRQAIVQEVELLPATPRCRALKDQIVWGRSPLRIDLAGGWTDTPPYCLQFGGKVVNAAVDLNGQPPVQVFARLCDRPELVIRSIDLGLEVRIRSYEELSSFTQIGSAFTIAKAAFSLAGFLPRFSNESWGSLEEQLREFGGGVELSLLCAVPKGSGLGTSSILAATVLGTLSSVCGLGWGQSDLFRRTLALEQMLTTGGGWQDQVGGMIHGLKLVETEPGLPQTPSVRWLPANALSAQHVLLYYTGVTRVAAGILHQVVRRMFLNARDTLEVLQDIGQHSLITADALQRQDWDAVGQGLKRAWILNQRLDRETNPPVTQEIFDSIADWSLGAKLLGAGGGGFMFIVAKDLEAARRIRERLSSDPARPTGRFVDHTVSNEGFQVTRS